ncbi:type II secretion system F family protein [Candidatus Woesebacteria bacterium]|nr:type II secretion system F family protein [Candidatus Woesebacteria bacterium]
MQRFRFRARSQEGQLRKGIVEAQSTNSAVQVLRDQKLIIIEIHEIGESKSIFSFGQKVKFEDVVNFTRQLSTMIGAGLPLTDALSILQLQVPPILQTKVADILRSIEGGSTFAQALSHHSDTFSRVYIALVKAGESAGVLDTILIRLADTLEKQREFREKTKGAMIYPVIVVIGMLLVSVVMMIFVLPKLTVMYKDFNVELPFVTKILMSTSSFMATYWYIMGLGIAGIVYLFKKWKQTKTGAYQYDELVLKLPIFGKIKSMVLMAEFSRTLALLASAGVSLVESLSIVNEVADSEVMRRALTQVGKDVEKGNTLAISLAKHTVFPMIVSQMTSVGEQTGKLDEILNRVAGYFENESEHAIKNLSTAMEPIIMVVLGVGVGFLIVAIIVPIYNLTSAF